MKADNSHVSIKYIKKTGKADKESLKQSRYNTYKHDKAFP